MRIKTRKIMVLLGIVCSFNTAITGCGAMHEYAARTPEEQTDEVSEEALSDMLSKENDTDMEKSKEDAAGKWQVLEPEIAAAVDADFKGKVWKIEEDSFYIVETKVKILDDGSLATSTPSSNAPIPDSQLIQVVFDDDTTFLVRTIYDNGESHEDEEAGFEDLREHMAVDMKGHFEEDVFHATQIRLPEIGNTGDAPKETKAEEEDAKADPIVGIVEKYENNIIIINDYGDGMSYYFSTKDAQIIEGNSPIAVGDKVEITYQGLLGDEKNPGDCSKVCKIE